MNRRRAHDGLEDLARQVLSQRGMARASAVEIRHFEASAARDYATIRRLSWPRHLLGRLVEVTAAFDRGAALEEADYAVEVVTLFDAEVTPRNIGVFATTDPARLPRVDGER